LAYRHGLDGPDLAEALGVSRTNANTMVHRLRETIERSLGALVVARRALNTPDGCHGLAAVLAGWDGHFSVLMRKRIARHIESCPGCDEDRRRLVSPAALLGAVPVFIPAPAWLRERTLSDVRLTCLGTSIAAVTADPGAADAVGSTDSGQADHAEGRRARKVMLLVALFVAILIMSLGLTIAWVFSRDTPITPTDLSDTATTSASPPLSTTPVQPTTSSSAAPATTVPAVTTPPALVTPTLRSPVLSASPVESEPTAAPTTVPTSRPSTAPKSPTLISRRPITPSRSPTKASVTPRTIPRSQPPTRASITPRQPPRDNPPR
jgi:hypothetical protein